ncbi:hypothetical protein [Dechloromonas sp.]|uniref:hypothetical protein n=1 Tax=Dechloromonas sp. TaxID=1917218 RepID=UPI00217160D4|nr:hypothetical protein [Dechloromonas sp.]MBU3695357.1 hypothetical protein [Dechloromonas sp.]
MEGQILLHPTAALIVWLTVVLATQHLRYAGLLGLVVVLVLAGYKAGRAWWRYVVRSRWLLLALWLILAYHTPGDAWLEKPWAPTLEGIHDASLQTGRLVVLLGALAWLFQELGRAGMVQGLWGLLRPLAGEGGSVARLVVRLSLVFSYFDRPDDGLNWRQMLAGEAPVLGDDVAAIAVDLPSWRWTDIVVVLIACMGFCGAVWL